MVIIGSCVLSLSLALAQTTPGDAIAPPVAAASDGRSGEAAAGEAPESQGSVAAGETTAVATDASDQQPTEPGTGASDTTVSDDDPEKAAVSVAAEPARARDAVLVLKLRSEGVDQEDAAMLTQRVSEALFELSSWNIVGTGDVDEVAGYLKTADKLGCETQACVAELSRTVNARFVLSGTVGKVGDELVLSLTLVDVSSNASVGSSSATAKTLSDLADSVPDLIAPLFAEVDGGIGSRRRFELPEGREISVAIFDLKSPGLSATVAQNLTQVLALEIKQIRGASVISRDDIASMLQLEANKNAFDCADEMSCLAEIGGALGVDKLIVGQTGMLAEQYIVSLRLIDVRAAVVNNRVMESFTGEESQLLYAVRRAGRRLLGVDDSRPGGASLTAAQPDAQVYLDDEPIGVLPMPPITELEAGRHTLRVAKEGYYDYRTQFYVDSGATTALWIDLREVPEYWYEKWWVWTALGAAVAGGVTTAIILSLPSGATLAWTGPNPGVVR